MVKTLSFSVVFMSLFLGTFSQNFVSSAFYQSPDEIIDTSFVTDFPFTKSIHAGNYVDNSSLVIWGINWTDTAPVNLTRRLIDMSNYYQIGSDVLFHTKVNSSVLPNFTTTVNGYFGMLTIGPDNDTTRSEPCDQIFISVMLANATVNTTMSKYQITNNDNPDITYAIYYFGSQNDKFYMTYVTRNVTQKVELDIYIRGFQADMKAEDSSPFLLSSLLRANTRILSNKYWTTNVFTGITLTALNYSVAAITWKDHSSNHSLLSTVNIDNGVFLSQGIVLLSDDKIYSYLPTGVATGNLTYAPIYRTMTGLGASRAYGLVASLGGNRITTKLNIPTHNGYIEPSVHSPVPYYDGWAQMVSYTPSSGFGDEIIEFQTFFANGTMNGSAYIVATANGKINGILMSDSSYVCVFEERDEITNTIQKVFAGVLLRSTQHPSLYGNNLSNVIILLFITVVGVLFL